MVEAVAAMPSLLPDPPLRYARGVSLVRPVLLCTLLMGGTALACRCTNPSETKVAYQRATAVVRAKVMKLRPMPARRGAKASLAISDAWKRAMPRKLDILSVDLCYYPLRRGEEYVLFLYRDGRDFITTRCSGNQSVDEAEETLSWLSLNGEAMEP
jgi:hypothetical protein